MVNRVRCFNHTIQLAVKALLRPFSAGLTASSDDDDLPELEDINDAFEEDTDDEDEDEADDVDDSFEPNCDIEDGIDELEELGEQQRECLIADTAVIRTTLSKVRTLLYQLLLSSPSYRFEALRSPLFAQVPLRSRHGVASARTLGSNQS